MESKRVELVGKSDTYKLIIPRNVEDKIRYLCQKIWKDEWSGTLFYTPEGSFEDGSLTIKCVDIFVMDIGTAAYTEFDMSPDVISYMTKNPELLDCQMGLIHSHNQMKAFFSGTDISTLEEEGMDRNHFVSLIVNNEGTYTAAITRKVHSNGVLTENFSYPTFGGEEIKDTKTYEEQNDRLEWFHLDIEIEGDNQESYKEISDRLDEIRQEKVQKAKNQYASLASTTNLGTKEASYSFGKNKPEVSQSVVNRVGPSNFIGNDSNYKQGTFDWEYIDNKKPSVHFYNDRFNKATVDTLVRQIITGSIIISESSKIDVEKWAKNMVPLYKKRFGVGKDRFEEFETWAEQYLDFLVMYTTDANLTKLGYDEEDIISILSNNLIEELKKLPRNEYIVTYIDILSKYV